MAALTRAESQNNHKHISETLLSSHETEEHQWLYGDAPSGTYHSLDRLSKFLGLETEAATKQWFESKQFKPIFDALYYKVIEPRTLVSPGRQGPQLTAVQNAIVMGEAHGNRKYTSWTMSESGFDDIDYYALCLIRLREENKHSHGGIFRNKQMTDQQIEQRLWHAIMRETSQRSKLRKRASGEASRQFNEKKKKTSHQQPMIPGTMNQQTNSPAITEQQPMPPATMEQQLQLVDVEQRREDSIAADQQQELPNFVEQQPEPAASNGPPSDTSYDSTDTAEAFFDFPPSNAADDENRLSLRDQLIQTKNNENPYDLGTSYGRYAAITAVLKHYSDRTRLQRAVEKPLDPGTDAAQLSDAYNKWSEEVDAMVADGATLELTPATEKQKKDFMQSEKLLDNADYQPMNYL